MEEKKHIPFVFVLIPLNSDFDDIYQFGIKEACTEAGARCEKVSEQYYDGNITNRIYKQIEKADIIIADMTGQNPNVFYETGYAHALSKRVILLTQNIKDIPFDLKNYHHIIYGGKIAELREKLSKKISWAIENPKESPGEKIKIWKNREDVKPTFIDRIKSVKKSLFLIGVTFESTFKDHKNALFEAIKKNNKLKVKILLLHPDSLHIEAHKEFTDRDMSFHIKEAINSRFKNIYDNLNEDQRKRLNINATFYLPRIAIRIYDDNIMLVNLYLFNSKAHNNPVFEITHKNNEEEFKRIRDSCIDLFNYGYDGNCLHPNYRILEKGIFKPL